MKTKIFVDRGNGLETDGCWGGENNNFKNKKKGMESLKFLSEQYPDCSWVLTDKNENIIFKIGRKI